MPVARTVARNSSFLLAGRGVTMALALAALILVSRYLGPEEFGRYQVIIAFLAVVNLSDLGVSFIAVRHLSTNERPPEQVLANVLTLRVTLALLSAVVAVLAAFLFVDSREMYTAVGIASLSFLLLVFATSYNSVFMARLRMEFVALGNISQAAVALVAMAIVALQGGGLVALVIAYNAGALAHSVVSLFFGRRFISARFGVDPRYMRALVTQSLPVGVAAFVLAGSDRVGILMLSIFTEPQSVGYFAFAYRIIDFTWPVSMLFVGAVFPLMATFYADGNRQLKAMYQRSQDVLILGGIPLTLMAILFTRQIIGIVGGSEYLPALVPFVLLSLAIVPVWLNVLTHHALIAFGRQSIVLWLSIATLVLSVGANAVLIPPLAERGAATAVVITEVVTLLPALYLVARYVGSSLSFEVPLRLMPVALVTVGVVYFSPLPWVVDAGLAAVVFSAGVLAFRAVVISDVKAMLRRDDVSAVASAVAEGGGS